MIFNLGSFFNSAKRQAMAEREREHQIYARWAEASRRAETGPDSNGANAGSRNPSDPRSNGEWVVGNRAAETMGFEEEVTYSLTEADIVEADELLEEVAPPRGNGLSAGVEVSRSATLNKTDSFEEESGRNAGEYLGGSDYSGPEMNVPDDRQFELPFASPERISAPQETAVSVKEAAEPAYDIAFRDLWRSKVEASNSVAVSNATAGQGEGQGESKQPAAPISPPMWADLPLEPSVMETPAVQSTPLVNSIRNNQKAEPSISPLPDSIANLVSKDHLERLPQEKRGPAFLRGLSAAVERTIASASAASVAALHTARESKPLTASRPAAGPIAGWNRPNPVPAFTTNLSGNIPASALAKPARLSSEGMLDDRIRPLDTLKTEPEKNSLSAPAVGLAPIPAVAPISMQQQMQLEGRVPPADMQVEVERDLRARFGGNIRSALGCGTVIEGKFTFDSPVRIDGALTGEVISNSLLIVGEHAVVRARVEVGSLIVLGEVTGDVIAEDLIEIRSTGQLRGDIVSHRLAVQEGGFFQGNVILTNSGKKPKA